MVDIHCGYGLITLLMREEFLWETKSLVMIYLQRLLGERLPCAPSLLITARDIPQIPGHVKKQRKAFLAILQERGGI